MVEKFKREKRVNLNVVRTYRTRKRGGVLQEGAKIVFRQNCRKMRTIVLNIFRNSAPENCPTA